MRGWLEQGKKWMGWGFSRRDYLSIKRVLDLEKQGEVKLCSKCRKSLNNRLKELQKTPYKLCKFCDTIMGIDENVCPNCKRSQN